jgi:4-amino-4-deoxychorismate lyase
VPQRIVAVLGTGVVRGDAVLAADDLGLTRGDGCFEATRIVTEPDGSHHIDHLEAHLRRFQASAIALMLPDVDGEAWRRLIETMLGRWSLPGEAMLKLMLTRGLESSPSGPVTGIATLTELSPTSLAQRADGVAVVTLSRATASDAFSDAPWLLGGVKSLSYAVNVAAQREAARRGADDVIFTSSDGFVLEAPTAAVVWMQQGTLLTTPTGPTGILDSITQKALFEAASRTGMTTSYVLGTVQGLRAAEGAWLVSSGRGIAAVTALDGVPLDHDPSLSRRLAKLAGF